MNYPVIFFLIKRRAAAETASKVAHTAVMPSAVFGFDGVVFPPEVPPPEVSVTNSAERRIAPPSSTTKEYFPFLGIISLSPRKTFETL